MRQEQEDNETRDFIDLYQYQSLDEKEPDTRFTRILADYTPKSVIVAQVLTGVLNAFAFPLLGYFCSEIVFILKHVPQTQEVFEAARNEWVLQFFAFILLVSLSQVLSRYSIQAGSENLTFNLR